MLYCFSFLYPWRPLLSCTSLRNCGHSLLLGWGIIVSLLHDFTREAALRSSQALAPTACLYSLFL